MRYLCVRTHQWGLISFIQSITQNWVLDRRHKVATQHNIFIFICNNFPLSQQLMFCQLIFAILAGLQRLRYLATPHCFTVSIQMLNYLTSSYWTPFTHFYISYCFYSFDTNFESRNIYVLNTVYKIIHITLCLQFQSWFWISNTYLLNPIYKIIHNTLCLRFQS